MRTPIRISPLRRRSPRVWLESTKDSIAAAVYKGNAYIDADLPSLPRQLARSRRLARWQRNWRASAFGDAVVDFYVHTARLEVQAFDNVVTDWERARYFEKI